MQKLKRNFLEIKDKGKINKILDNYAEKTSFFIKGIEKASKISFTRKGNYIKLHIPAAFKEYERMVIFTLLNNYMELNLKLIPYSNVKHVYIVEAIKIAKESRRHFRYNSKGYNIQLVKFTNLKEIKPINPKKIPVYVRVLMKNYENKHRDIFSPASLLIDTYEFGDNIAKVTEKTKKIVYVRNTKNLDDYLKQDDDTFVTYIKNYKKMFVEFDSNISQAAKNTIMDEIKTEVNKEIRSEMEKMEEEEIKSLLYYPIIYDRNTEEFTDPFPIGFIKVYTDTKPRSPYIEEDIIPEIKEVSKEICDTIAMGSSKSLEVDEEIVDISQTGLSAIIRNEDLKKIVLDTKNEVYRFDVHFPKLPNLSFWGRVVN